MLAFTTIIILVTKCDIVKELEVFWLLYKQMNQVVTLLCGYGCTIYNNSPCRPKFSCIIFMCCDYIYDVSWLYPYCYCTYTCRGCIYMLWLYIFCMNSHGCIPL